MRYNVASFVSQGKLVGRVQARSGWGPRSLGNTRVLADPRNMEMQKRLNLKIKYRESFRPFAPAVLEEELNQYFELSQVSPYMLLIGEVKKELRKELPGNYHDLPLRDKLYFIRSTL